MKHQRRQTRRVTVPYPLPSRRGEVQLPKKLTREVEDALGVRDIEALQKTISTTLEATGWTEQLRAYLRQAITNDINVNEEELKKRVLQSIKPREDKVSPNEEPEAAEKELWDGEVKARETLEIPKELVDVTADFVKETLTPICTVVDAVDWESQT